MFCILGWRRSKFLLFISFSLFIKKWQTAQPPFAEFFRMCGTLAPQKKNIKEICSYLHRILKILHIHKFFEILHFLYPQNLGCDGNN